MTDRAYLECRVGNDYLLVLDGRVVELFHLRKGDQGDSWRWHVSTLGIDAGLRRSKVILRVGDRKENGELRSGALMIEVPAEEMERLAAFIEAAIAARDS